MLLCLFWRSFISTFTWDKQKGYKNDNDKGIDKGKSPNKKKDQGDDSEEEEKSKYFKTAFII